MQSPNTLIPSQPYTLSYYITDHLDAGTYYVRAVVYDATTGEVLDTQNLTQQTTNSHLFSKVTQAPGDSSGRGRRIIVVATAYTDSGYTSKSDLYQEQAENYIVIGHTAGGATGGGGYTIDYRVIREMFGEEFASVIEYWKKVMAKLTSIGMQVEKIPTEETEDIDLSLIQAELKNCGQMMTQLLAKNIDLKPVLMQIKKSESAVLKGIDEKEVTEVEDTDMSPVIDSVKQLEGKVLPVLEKISGNVEKESARSEKLRNLRALLADPDITTLIEKESPPIVKQEKTRIPISSLM